METKKQSDSSPPSPPPASPPRSSSSTLTAELFGDTDSPPSPTGAFSSIFADPATAFENYPSCPKFMPPTQKDEAGRVSAEELFARHTACASCSLMNRGRKLTTYEPMEPTPLGSALYYGGLEDNYVSPSSDPKSKSYSKKPDGKNDTNLLDVDIRGNWWAGSLYY